MTVDPVAIIRYQYDNHLGSASLELDENAAIISYEEYHPFGTTSYRSGRTETETSQKRYKYVGKERDEETGLYYYGFRYYAAWICRFVSVDPLQFEYPQLTPFNYAGNKPITHIDIDGLQSSGDEKRGTQNQNGGTSPDPNDLLRKFNEFLGFANPKDTTLLQQALNSTAEKLWSSRNASDFYLNRAMNSEVLSETQRMYFDLFEKAQKDVKKYERGFTYLLRKAYKFHKYNKNIESYNESYSQFLEESATILEYGTYGVTAIETMGALPSLIGSLRPLGSFFNSASKSGVRSSYKSHFTMWSEYATTMEMRGVSMEHIAKRVSNARLAARYRYQLQTPLFTRLSIYGRNVTPKWVPIRFPIGGKWIKPGGYGNPVGPSWRYYYNKGYSWEQIKAGALKSNAKL